MNDSRRCEDCSGALAMTEDELMAIVAGLTICQGCLDSMEQECDAYEVERIEAGRRRAISSSGR